MTAMPTASKQITLEETLTLMKDNATLLNKLEQDHDLLRIRIKEIEKESDTIKSENNDLTQTLETMSRTKEEFFESFEKEFKKDDKYIAQLRSTDKVGVGMLLKTIQIQTDRLKTFNDKFLSTLKQQCKNCHLEFYEDENEEESCTMHPGVLRYYDCANCSSKECFNCCGSCFKCSHGCKKSFHIVSSKL